MCPGSHGDGPCPQLSTGMVAVGRVGRVLRCSSRRWRASIVLPLLLVLVFVVVLCVPVTAAASLSTEELDLVTQVNAYREANNLAPLLVSVTLSDSAARHSSDMGRYGFFGHTTQQSDYFPIGSAPWDRMRLCGYPQAAMGENIAAGAALSTGSAVFERWRASPTHDDIMLSPSFKVVGVSRGYVAGSPYGYYWTADFGGYVDATAYPPGGMSTTSSTSTTVAAPSTTTTMRSLTTTTTARPPASTTTTTAQSAATTTLPPAVSPAPGTTPTTISWVSQPPVPTVSPFSDVPTTHLFYGSICTLHAEGVMTGFGDGLFRPDDFVRRAQMAKILVLAQGSSLRELEPPSRATFSDVPPGGGDYPFIFVEQAAEWGIVEGRPDGSFAPYEHVTRAQLALMVVRAGGSHLAAPPTDYHHGLLDVPPFAAEAVRIATYNGLLSGTTVHAFDPYSFATRGQVAKVVWALVVILGMSGAWN